MGEKRTFSGKTLDEALEAATRSYKKPREEIEYRVLVEKKTLFGLAKMVTIEVKEEEIPPIVRMLLNRIIVGVGLQISYDISENDDTLFIELSGDDLGLILHRNGELMDAIQTLMIQALKQADYGNRIIIDADNFRKKLKSKLQRIARQTAQKARQEGKPQKLNPMPPHLRKIVHLSLANTRDLSTHSEGDGFLKQVVISARRR